MRSPRVLLTGFAPYKEPLNASGCLIESMTESLPDTLLPLREQLFFKVIKVDDHSRDTEHESLETALESVLAEHQPDICIHTGQAPPYNRVTIEKVATNSFMRKIIDPKKPVAYWSNLPGTDSLKSILEAQHIPAGYSFYGGQHLCNHILYSCLHLAQSKQLSMRAGFVHIPLLPEQIIERHSQAAFMPLSMTRQALTLIVQPVCTCWQPDTAAIET